MKIRGLPFLLSIAEIVILFIIGLLLNQNPDNKNLVEIFGFVSFIVVLNRIISTVDNNLLVKETFSALDNPINHISTTIKETFSALFNPIKYLSTTVDINTSSKVDEIKNLLNIYISIVNPQLESIKETILQRTIRELEQLNYEQRTPVLDEPDFYKWLYTEFENAKSSIHIVSMDEELEWTDTPEEKKFYRINVETAQRNIELIRIFVFAPDRYKKARNNTSIFGHRKGSDTKLIGKYVNKDRFEKQARGAIEAAGQGFIVIDGRMVIIDVFSADGQARGYITFNPTEIKKYETLFNKFNAVAMDLEFPDDEDDKHPDTNLNAK